MKNRKQLLADFYLDLLAIKNPSEDIKHLKNAVCFVLSNELESDMETVQDIFARMAREDAKI